MARRDDLIDEGWPIMRPFLFQNGDQNQVKLVQESAFSLQTLLRL